MTEIFKRTVLNKFHILVSKTLLSNITLTKLANNNILVISDLLNILVTFKDVRNCKKLKTKTRNIAMKI